MSTLLRVWNFIATLTTKDVSADDLLLFPYCSRATAAVIHGENHLLSNSVYFARVNFFDSTLTRFSEACRAMPFLTAFMDDKMRFPAFLSVPLESLLHCNGVRCIISPGKLSSSGKGHLPESRHAIAFIFNLLQLLQWDGVSLLLVHAIADCVHAAVSMLTLQGLRNRLMPFIAFVSSSLL